MLACPLEDRVLLHLKVGFSLPPLTNGQMPCQNVREWNVLVDATISFILATKLLSPTVSQAARKRVRGKLTLPYRHPYRRHCPSPRRYAGPLWS
jgi:hypothetical protein